MAGRIPEAKSLCIFIYMYIYRTFLYICQRPRRQRREHFLVKACRGGHACKRTVKTHASREGERKHGVSPRAVRELNDAKESLTLRGAGFYISFILRASHLDPCVGGGGHGVVI